MEFLTTGLIRKRNFYTQNTNFGVAADLYVEDATGEYRFGLSGSQIFEIVLKSGKMYHEDVLLHSYYPFQRFNLELQQTTTGFNLIKDNVPLVYGAGKPSGNYDHVFITRAHTNMAADFNFYVSGANAPAYSIDLVGYYFNSGQAEVTGRFINQAPYPIRVFNSTAMNTQTLTFARLTGLVNPTGLFKYSGDAADYNEFDFTQPIYTTFYTTFDRIAVPFQIVDTRSFNRFVFLQAIDDYGFSPTNTINRDLFYTNYSGGFVTSNFNANLTFALEYVSGSGSFAVADFATGAYYNTTLYGSFRQSGLLTGQQTTITGSSELTGYYVVNLAQFAWATGAVTGYFSGVGTGLATGIGYTGLAVGPVTGQITGFVYPGSGTLLYNSAAVGIGLNPSYSISYTGFGNATGYVDVSSLEYDDWFYIGVESVPIIKGVQFSGASSLAAYLSGSPAHKVSALISSNLVYLTALSQGEAGNGVFVRSGSCTFGTLTGFTEYLTGGFNIGNTGTLVYPAGPYTGGAFLTMTGSGNYSQAVSGNATGLFYYERTFTGVWDLLTGVDSTSLVSLNRAGNRTSTVISGGGMFAPNSLVNFQITHDESPFNVDGVRLVISGNEVLNPITQLIAQ